MVLARAGADRQKMHQVLRKHALQAWSAVREGKSNPMIELVSTDPNLLEFITKKEISRAMEGSVYLGDAAERAKNLSDKIKIEING